MKICKACKSEIDEEATKCPHCGTSQTSLTSGCLMLLMVPVAIWAFFGFMNLLFPNPNTSGSAGNKAPQVNPSPQSPQQSFTYQIKLHDERDYAESYEVLIDPKDDSHAESIAREIKCQYKGQCRIDIYDDEKALELDNSQFSAVLDNLANTDTDNFQTQEIYIADHFVGRITFSGQYESYPNRNTDTYHTLKAQPITQPQMPK